MRITIVFAAWLALTFVQPRPARAWFTPPDGHWWLAAGAEERDGFETGEVDCDAYMLRHRIPAPNADQFQRAVTEYYRDHPGSLGLPVTEVISRLYRAWAISRTYPVVRAPLAREFTSDIWWNAPPASRDGIIRGFLSCQAAEQDVRTQIPVEEIVRRVSLWYGIAPNREGVVNPTTANDALSRVILWAESPKPKR